MKLYLVQRESDDDYDVLNGVLVRAKNEQEARRMVAEKHGDEGYDVWFMPSTRCFEVHPLSICEIRQKDLCGSFFAGAQGLTKLRKLW